MCANELTNMSHGAQESHAPKLLERTHTRPGARVRVGERTYA
jgi:hypothetical protein